MAQDEKKMATPDQPAQPPNDKVDADPEWTIMLYLAGDNNLNEEMVLTLQEFQEISEETTLWPRAQILARLDPSGVGLTTENYAFPNEERIGEGASEGNSLEDYRVPNPFDPREDNSGNPKAISGFVKGSANRYNENREGKSALILSGHGSGATENFLLKDESSLDSLSIRELKEALRLARMSPEWDGDTVREDTRRRIDLIGFDSCFMSMLEVCYEIREHVDFVVGAQSPIPDFGWPYHRIFKRAGDERAQKGGTDPIGPDELARIIVEEYIEYYADYDRTAGRSADLAAIQTHGRDLKNKSAENDLVKELAESIHELAKVLIEELDNDDSRDQIHLAHMEAQTYKYDQFVDLQDFCTCLEERLPGIASKRCNEVRKRLRACVVLSGCSGFAYQYSHGLSIYFPWAILQIPHSYKSLAFNLDFADPKLMLDDLPLDDDTENSVTWALFLDKYLERTRRDRRKLGNEYMSKEAFEDERLGRIDYFNKSIDQLMKPYIDPLITEVELLRTETTKNEKAAIRKRATEVLRRAAGFRGEEHYKQGGSRYDMSRYDMSRYDMSRYDMSRYDMSRSSGDREQSVKNFEHVAGMAFFPSRTEKA